jgi:hypothetical protein
MSDLLYKPFLFHKMNILHVNALNANFELIDILFGSCSVHVLLLRTNLTSHNNVIQSLFFLMNLQSAFIAILRLSSPTSLFIYLSSFYSTIMSAASSSSSSSCKIILYILLPHKSEILYVCFFFSVYVVCCSIV